GAAERLRTAFVSEGFFSTLGTRAALGRTLDPADQVEGRNHVVVLSYSTWLHRFGADPRVVGTTLGLDGEPTVVVGILPPEMHFPDDKVEAFVPLTVIPETGIPRARAVHFLSVVGRLRRGVTPEQAQRD